jgi:phosphate transport system substrate-binding protein
MALIRWPVAILSWNQAVAVLAMAALQCGCGPSSGERPDANAGGDSAGETTFVLPANISQLSGVVKIDGSSSLFPVTEAAAEEFQLATKGKVKVTLGEGGTGSGFKRLLRGEIDLCDASRPITNDEREVARQAGIAFIELPVCFDALTVAVHPSNPLESISTADLKTMWSPEAQETVLRWSDVHRDWPDEELVLFGAGASSGTFEYFTGAVNGKARSSRGDYTASEDDNVLVQGIAGNRHSLGYIPFAYFEPNRNRLKALAIDWDKDTEGPVAPNLENVEQGKYNPFSRPLFLYVNAKEAERPEVRAFVEFYLRNARAFATEQNYLPLPEAAYGLVLERFAQLQSGTAFDGEPAFGLGVEEILKRPLRKQLSD